MKKVLIVDDDKAYRNALKLEFELSGFKVIEAGSGDEAIQKTQEELPDLILLDIILPGKIGLNVLRILKKNKATAEIPVIGMSNFGGEANRKEVLGAGAVLFIEKQKTLVHQIVEMAKLFAKGEEIKLPEPPTGTTMPGF